MQKSDSLQNSPCRTYKALIVEQPDDPCGNRYVVEVYLWVPTVQQYVYAGRDFGTLNLREAVDWAKNHGLEYSLGETLGLPIR